jgi:hypothetical protein
MPKLRRDCGRMWVLLCERSDVDVSREANVGRGPVDFKFSAGWRRRALIELKLMSSRKLRQGAEAQLPQSANAPISRGHATGVRWARCVKCDWETYLMIGPLVIWRGWRRCLVRTGPRRSIARRRGVRRR